MSEPSSDQSTSAPLMGLAVLMTMVCSGIALTDTANQMIERIKRNPRDANALMDLSIISHLWFKPDLGLMTQKQALSMQRLYRLPAIGEPRIRLLALMQQGDLAANMPLEFLVQDSDIALDMLFLDATEEFPAHLPEHDAIIIAVSESERSRPLLQLLERQMSQWDKPVLNRPERIMRLSRDSVSQMLQGLRGIEMPLSAQLARADLAQIDQQSLTRVLADGQFPIIVRPVDSHAGHGLKKVDTPQDISAYLEKHAELAFVISRFVDYSNTDSLYRKYRIVLVDGVAYAGHMAISEHWMIHYLNAHMSASQEKRDEEAKFMEDFDTGFGARHQQALQAIHQAAGLNYLVIDCAEAPDRRLLVFEIDSAAVIHAMDSAELFPYKRAQAQRVFVAFQSLLQRIFADSAK